MIIKNLLVSVLFVSQAIAVGSDVNVPKQIKNSNTNTPPRGNDSLARVQNTQTWDYPESGAVGVKLDGTEI
jgi:hypothetical protein